MSRVKPTETKGKFYSMNPQHLREVQELLRDKYRDVATSRVQGPDSDGSYWCYVNIFREAEQ